MNRSRSVSKPPHPRRPRRRTLALVATVVVVLLVAVAGAVLLGAGRRSGAGRAGAPVAPITPWGGPATPDPSLEWWSPVHGEPLGVAVDGGDVAVTALDEVRLLDGGSGATRWKAGFAGVRQHRPALGGNRVAATSETEMVVLHRADGTRVATVPFAGPGPAALLPAPGGRAVAVAGSETGAILALDADTGAVLWSGSYPGQVTVAPRGEAGLVIASWHDRAGATVRALDASTGGLRWEVPAGPTASAPAVAAGAVVFAEGEHVHAARVRAVDPRTGRDRWVTPLSGWFDDEIEPAVDPTTVYLLDGLGTVTALDLATGAVRWQQETGRPVLGGRLVLTPDAAMFASDEDELVVLDRATGRLRSAAVQRGVPNDVAAAPGRVVVALRLSAPSRVEAQREP